MSATAQSDSRIPAPGASAITGSGSASPARISTVSKRSILAAARRRYGKTVYIEERKAAATPERRAEARERIQQINARMADLEGVASRSTGDALHKELLKAAQFVCDVNGDEPSMSHLLTAVSRCNSNDELVAEYNQLYGERNELRRLLHSYRWHVLTISAVGGVRFAHHKLEADTLAELLTKIEGGEK